MNTDEIPDGWWLNVTLMAKLEEAWLVAVIRRGKSTHITEFIKCDLPTSKVAYEIGMTFISNYKKK